MKTAYPYAVIFSSKCINFANNGESNFANFQTVPIWIHKIFAIFLSTQIKVNVFAQKFPWKNTAANSIRYILSAQWREKVACHNVEIAEIYYRDFSDFLEINALVVN